MKLTPNRFRNDSEAEIAMANLSSSSDVQNQLHDLSELTTYLPSKPQLQNSFLEVFTLCNPTLISSIENQLNSLDPRSKTDVDFGRVTSNQLERVLSFVAKTSSKPDFVSTPAAANALVSLTKLTEITKRFSTITSTSTSTSNSNFLVLGALEVLTLANALGASSTPSAITTATSYLANHPVEIISDSALWTPTTSTYMSYFNQAGLAHFAAGDHASARLCFRNLLATPSEGAFDPIMGEGFKSLMVMEMLDHNNNPHNVANLLKNSSTATNSEQAKGEGGILVGKGSVKSSFRGGGSSHTSTSKLDESTILPKYLAPGVQNYLTKAFGSRNNSLLGGGGGDSDMIDDMFIGNGGDDDDDMGMGMGMGMGMSLSNNPNDDVDEIAVDTPGSVPHSVPPTEAGNSATTTEPSKKGKTAKKSEIKILSEYVALYRSFVRGGGEEFSKALACVTLSVDITQRLKEERKRASVRKAAEIFASADLALIAKTAELESEDEAKRVVEALVERGQLRATVDGQGLCRFSELTKTTQDDVNAKLKDCGLLSERMKITQSVMAEEAIREEAENDIVM